MLFAVMYWDYWLEPIWHPPELEPVPSLGGIPGMTPEY